MTKISLLALFVSERNEIKSRLEEFYGGAIDWVPLTSPTIDILITRAKFLETPTILQQITKSQNSQKLKMALTVATTEEEKAFSEGMGIPSLLLPIQTHKELLEWLSADSSDNQIIAHTGYYNDQVLSFNEFLMYISKHAKSNTQLQTIEVGEALWVIDFQNLKIYCTQNKFSLHEGSQFKLTNQPIDTILREGAVFDLASLLWILLNESKSIQFEQFFQKETRYTLSSWPLFVKQLKEYRFEALSLVASLQKTSYSYDSIASRNDEKLIKLFSLLNILGYLEISGQTMDLMPNQAVENVKKTGLIGKFRNFISQLV